MKKNSTLLVTIIDRSGSMASVKQATEKGFADFIEDQKKQAGECKASLYQFDDKFEVVYENVDLKNVGEYTLVPRGWTALLDAIGYATSRVGEQLAKLPESQRPEHVIVSVLSDGAENRSREYTQNQIKEIIERQSNIYSWKFIFLGCNQDAITVGKSYGFSKDLSLTFNATVGGTKCAYMAMNTATSALRSCSNYSFSDSDRELAAKS